MKRHILLLFQKHAILKTVTIGIVFLTTHGAKGAEIEFNDQFLNASEKATINLQNFSQDGYVMPGHYSLMLRVNKKSIKEQDIEFVSNDGGKTSNPCLTKNIVDQFNLTDEVRKKLAWSDQGQCLLIDSLPGLTVDADIYKAELLVNVPQAYLVYHSDNWDGPAQWENGLSGVMLDYNLTANTTKSNLTQASTRAFTGYGVLGFNIDAWRFRGEWQSNFDNTQQSTEKKFTWQNVYAYRALPDYGAKLTVGQNYFYSSIFDSFQYLGANISSDDDMLPPNLRGYAPEVTGTAKTTAKVTISQNGKIIYETQVPAGFFRIQDLNSAITGILDVTVEEQDGSVEKFQVNTATIPYLTRPGQIRYKFSLGKPYNSSTNQQLVGPDFATGEFSWGIKNGFSLYGGSILGTDYQSAAIGIGRDLSILGALSFDVTAAVYKPSWQSNAASQSGDSYRLSYSKRFGTDSQITFAGYRFTDQHYMSLGDYVSNISNQTAISNRPKEKYSISYNKNFADSKSSFFLNYYKQTYWDIGTVGSYSVNFSRYFDIGNIKNISLSFTASKNINVGDHNKSYLLTLTMPLDSSRSVSYLYNKDNSSTESVNYNQQLDAKNNNQLSVMHGTGSGTGVSDTYSHLGDAATVNSSVAYYDNSSYSAMVSAVGGITATANGINFHRTAIMGGTRVLVDANGAVGVPVLSSGPSTATSGNGMAVITGINGYYPSTVSLDVNHMPNQYDVTANSIEKISLTEGAIGYRKFEVISGAKQVVSIKTADGSVLPFGASVKNSDNQELGIVEDEGRAYLFGLNPRQKLYAYWGGRKQCTITLPDSMDKVDSLQCNSNN